MAVVWEAPYSEETRHWIEVVELLNRIHFVPRAAELDRAQRYPWENVQKLVDAGAAGLMIPKEFGGQGASLETGAAVMAELSRGCASTGAIFGIYSMCANPIVQFGTSEQKRFCLDEITRGRAVSFGLTERGAGSDPTAIKATGVRQENGWRLSGEKIFVGNGGASQHYIAFVVTDPEAGRNGISAFLTSLDDEGTEVTKYADRLGLRGSQTSNLVLDTWVPEDRLLGKLGDCLRIAISTLNAGRVIVSGQGVGLATAAFEHAATEARHRSTFGSALIDKQTISFALVDAATKLSAARMMTFVASNAGADSPRTRALASMAKLYSTEIADEIADLAVQIFGGDGYCKPNPVERIYRDVRISRVYEGSSEIQKIVLGRELKKELEEGMFAPVEARATAYGHEAFS